YLPRICYGYCVDCGLGVPHQRGSIPNSLFLPPPYYTLQTKTAIIKETLAARKNTTPQTNYETGHLYAAGALKLACVGLQCVGFSQEVYQVVSELSTRLLHSTAAAAAAAASSSSSKTPSESPNLVA